MAQKKWTREEIVRVFEILIERGATTTSDPRFGGLLDRDLNLYANQVTREANGNIAYRSVDIDLATLSDDEMWALIDGSEYSDLIQSNAAAALIKMVEKFDLTS